MSNRPVQRLRAAEPLLIRACPWIAVLAGGIMIARTLCAICTFSHTIDEPYHIGSALVLYESHRAVVGAQHPPLARWVAGLPLWLQGVRLPAARGEYIVTEYPAFPIGEGVLFSHQIPYWRMLITARTALLVFPILSMFLLYRLGHWIAGPVVAMMATVFFSTDPTFLGHSTWIGTDSAACAGFVAGIYYGLRFIARPSWTRTWICGCALGLAIA